MKLTSTALLSACLSLAAAAHPDPGHTLAELDKHLAESPDDSGLLHRKAELLLQSGHPQMAAPLVARALERSPADPSILLLQARLAQAAGKRGEAVARVTEITRLHPKFAAGWDLLARYHHDAGRRDEAIPAKLHQLDVDAHPGPGDFLTCAAWLRDRGQPGDADAALAILDRGIARFGGLTGLQQAAITLECSLGRHAAALARVDALVKKFRPSIEFSLLRVEIFEAAGRYREAAAACDSAIALCQPMEKSPDHEVSKFRQEILRRKNSNLGMEAVRTNSSGRSDGIYGSHPGPAG